MSWFTTEDLELALIKYDAAQVLKAFQCAYPNDALQRRTFTSFSLSWKIYIPMTYPEKLKSDLRY